MLELLRNVLPKDLHDSRLNFIPLLQLCNWKSFQFYPPMVLFIIYLKSTKKLWNIAKYNDEKRRTTITTVTTLRAFHLYIFLSVNSEIHFVCLLVKKHSWKHIIFEFVTLYKFFEGLRLVFSLTKSLTDDIWFFSLRD